MRKRNWKIGFFCASLDIAVAFDSVGLPILFEAMKYHGINYYLGCLIARDLERISRTWIYEGAVTQGGKLKKGLSQRDTLSPFLFLLVAVFVLDPLVTNWKEKN